MWYGGLEDFNRVLRHIVVALGSPGALNDFSRVWGIL